MKRTVKIIDAQGTRFTIEINVSTEGVGSGEKLSWDTVLPVKDKRRLSICGWHGGGGGQCYDSIEPRTPGQKQLIQLWKEYHLNDCCAGTRLQTEFLESKGQEQIQLLKNILVDAGYAQYISSRIENNIVTMPDYNIYVRLETMDSEHCLKVKRCNGKYEYFRPEDRKNMKDRWVTGLKDKWLKENYRHLSVFENMKIADVRKFAEKYDDYTGKFKDSSDYGLELVVLKAADLYIDRGYIYGRGWLMKELPATIEQDIEDLCRLLEEEEAERVRELAKEAGLEDFIMSNDDSMEDDEKHVAAVMDEMDLDKDEAIRFVALAKVLGESYFSLKEGWEVEDEEEQRYSFGSTHYYIGTSTELTQVAKDIINNDSEYEYFWKQAVAAGSTTDGLDAWKESIVNIDGFAHTLDRWNGQGSTVDVLGNSIAVCNAG